MNIGLDMRMAGEEYGIGRYSFELAKRIIEQDDSNTYFLFVRSLAKFNQSGFTQHKNVHLVIADFRHYSLNEQINFLRLLNRYRLDLVHFMNFNVPLFYRGKFIVTIHDVVHHKLPGNKKTRFLHRRAYRTVIANAAKRSKKIVTVSQFSKKEIAETFAIGMEKIKVIYEAATIVPVSDSDVIATRQKYGISKDYILFVGVMERKKNILALVKAFDLLKEQYQLNIQLVLAGKTDPYYPEVITEAKQIHYAKDLIFTGVVTDKEKFALYKGAQAFVSASLFEGFGLPGLEAMTMGTPLVVSNTSVFNEVYDNGAMYFDPLNPSDIAQKIALLLNDEKYRTLIANNAYARAQLFSWDKAAMQTIEVYQ